MLQKSVDLISTLVQIYAKMRADFLTKCIFIPVIIVIFFCSTEVLHSGNARLFFMLPMFIYHFVHT